MKRLRLLLPAFLLNALISNAQLTSTNLPIVIITTPATIGTSVVQGNLSIINNVFGANTPTDAPSYTGMIGIKLRGNPTTQSYPKKTYSIETWSAPSISLDTSLLNMPSENDWVLLASYPDRSLLRTTLSFNLHEMMGKYAPRMKFCEVIINSQYAGIYTFGEKIKRNTGRVNISKLTVSDNAGINLTGGYIWKIDDEASAGWTSSIAPPYATTQQINFNFEYPDANTITPAQKAYSKAFVDSFETAMNSSSFQDTTIGWRNFAAEGNFIDFMIMQEVSKNYEAYRVNTFLYKDKSKKLRVGPLWNGELAWANTMSWNASIDTGWAFNLGGVCGTETKLAPFWWQKLTTDTAFMNNLKCTYIDYRRTGNVLDTVNIFHYVDSVNTYLNAQNAVARNFALWPIWGTPIVNEPTPMALNYSEEIANLKKSIRNRLQWLDTKWVSTNCPNPLAIADVSFQSQVSVYPNPATDKVNVNVSGNQGVHTVSLFTIQGVKLLSTQTTFSRSEIDLSGFAAGVYILQVQGDKGAFTQKVIKE